MKTIKFFILTLLILNLSLPMTISHTSYNGNVAWAKMKRTKRSKRRVRRRRIRKFSLNFKDVDIKEFLNIMSQLIKKNIIMDDKVKGKISISSAKKVPVSEAYNIMKSILEIKGLAVVETGNLIKVIPLRDAIKKNVEIIIDGKKAIIKSGRDKTITFLLPVKFADANDIANSLKTLKSKFTQIVVYKPMNTIIFSGNSSEINGLIEITKSLDKILPDEDEDNTKKGPKKIKGNIHVVHLENSDAEKLAGVLSRIPFSQTAKINTSPVLKKKKIRSSRKSKRVTRTQIRTKNKKQKLSIIANQETNSLIITATPEEFKQIRRIIRELDTVRDQVLIEALIIEVGANNGWSFGIDWMLGNQTGSHIYGGSSMLSGTVPNYNASSIGSDKTLAVPLAAGLQLGYINDNSILSFALLNATGTDSKFNILSTPQILTLDNHEAELNVGQEIPVPTNNRISDSGTQFYTYDYKSVGVKLKITPHITKKSRITLDLFQTVDSVLGTTTDPTIPPTLGKRDIKTKVTVMDGRTIVVGGLITNNKKVSITKIPLLGDIPVIGWLFKHKTVSYEKTNLLVFITPHIVTNPIKLEAITKKKRAVQKKLRQFNK